MHLLNDSEMFSVNHACHVRFLLVVEDMIPLVSSDNNHQHTIFC